MKVRGGLLLGAILLVAVACKQEAEKPKVIYKEDGTSEVATETIKEKDRTEDIRIADLPVLMGQSDYLVHPIGEVRVYSYSSKSGMSKVNQTSYTVSNYAPFELTGYLENIMFQHKDSVQIRPLTNKKIQIQSVTYLNTIAEKTKKNILVYSMFDADTNRDGKLDSNDIKTLYISRGNGMNLKKLTVDLHELLDWTVIDSQNRLYFRSIEDINKNGAFDKDDNVNYYYIDLLSKDWEIISYDPFSVNKPIEIE
ncbi:hypothetical protein LNQ81_09865 [Myroides sp. M-43]|uniref:hypothetical protein n=1 Tax=Myroides oncorhynchi TaxID=2893756 RepID=UPI001E2FF37A|nr:hypothetical protein [Myroides oncorhynchi]MCC9042978.1 hypothetical protein [Myroides oncorhynchi]